MTQHAEQLLNQAMQLSQSEREVLADQLYLSLEETGTADESIKTAWSSEIARRLGEVDAGTVVLHSADEVHADVRMMMHGEQFANQISSGSEKRSAFYSAMVFIKKCSRRTIFFLKNFVLLSAKYKKILKLGVSMSKNAACIGSDDFHTVSFTSNAKTIS